MISRELGHNPNDHALQGLSFDSLTGFANGHQLPPNPVLHTVLPQRTHQQAAPAKYEAAYATSETHIVVARDAP